MNKQAKIEFYKNLDPKKLDSGKAFWPGKLSSLYYQINSQTQQEKLPSLMKVFCFLRMRKLVSASAPIL